MGNEEALEIRKVKNWLEQIVIRHNFCPFAKKPFKQNTIRFFLSPSQSVYELVDDLLDELLLLSQSDAEDIETTIMIIPEVFANFEEYNQFGNVLDQLIDELKLSGIIQIATFHPDYQFADLSADDVRNYTNRSPYPLFHLIREASVEKARITFPDIDGIPIKNMEKLETMGIEQVIAELDKL